MFDPMFVFPQVYFHTYYIGTRLYIGSIMSCEPVSLRVAKIPRTGETWYKVLYQHTTYVISLSNTLITKKIEQTTRVEVKLTNVLIYFPSDYILCMTSLYLLQFMTERSFPAFKWYDALVKVVRHRTSHHSIISMWQCGILYQTPRIRLNNFLGKIIC